MEAPAVDTLQPISKFIADNYAPAPGYKDATLRITTAELYERLVQQFPFEGFTTAALFNLLTGLGYHYEDSGDVKLEWLLIKKQ